ncbi:MAG: MerR family transcriptional regulator [Chitinophagia bacterium]|jgi:DNA-binding transcriptional MerR regulator
MMQLDLFGGEPVKQGAEKSPKKKPYSIAPPKEPILVAEPIEEIIAIESIPEEKKAPEVKPTLSPVIPPDELLNEKLYYPISEVATMFQVNISLLRFWEKEFDILKPRKNRKGDRLFRPEDIRNLKMIHFLLKEKGYTIKGAKAFIKKGKKADVKFEAIESLKKLKAMLIELRSGLV